MGFVTLNVGFSSLCLPLLVLFVGITLKRPLQGVNFILHFVFYRNFGSLICITTGKFWVRLGSLFE